MVWRVRIWFATRAVPSAALGALFTWILVRTIKYWNTPQTLNVVDNRVVLAIAVAGDLSVIYQLIWAGQRLWRAERDNKKKEI